MPKRTGPNGDYWAGKISSNVARDRKNDALLTKEGWLVLRFWEHDDPLAVAEVVKAAILVLDSRPEQLRSNRIIRSQAENIAIQ
jgi:G:T-mismatch repair DNA endonuclease (very short patch repair protein)